MNKKFIKEFYENRDNIVSKIIKDKFAWNDFISFWSRNLGYHSVDNLLTLYSYNPKGKLFATFDDWNENTERRIIRNSHGIPILINNKKVYVFDISQTWGKPFFIWKYNHKNQDNITLFYQKKYKLKFNPEITDYTKYSLLLKEDIKHKISENYLSLTKEEQNFIIETTYAILKRKLDDVLISSSDELLNYIENLNHDNFLKCIQIINKESFVQYKDFYNLSKTLDNVEKEIVEMAKDESINGSNLQTILENIETNSNINYDVLNSMYDNMVEKYRDKKEIISVET